MGCFFSIFRSFFFLLSLVLNLLPKPSEIQHGTKTAGNDFIGYSPHVIEFCFILRGSALLLPIVQEVTNSGSPAILAQQRLRLLANIWGFQTVPDEAKISSISAERPCVLHLASDCQKQFFFPQFVLLYDSFWGPENIKQGAFQTFAKASIY